LLPKTKLIKYTSIFIRVTTYDSNVVADYKRALSDIESIKTKYKGVAKFGSKT
jgi:flavorubredoxin